MARVLLPVLLLPGIMFIKLRDQVDAIPDETPGCSSQRQAPAVN